MQSVRQACPLEIDGGSPNLLKNFECMGGEIIASVKPELLGRSVASYAGVVMEGCAPLPGCLLTVCNASGGAVQLKVKIVDLASAGVQGAICLRGRIHATLAKSVISRNLVCHSLVQAHDYSILLVTGTSMQDNTIHFNCGLTSQGDSLLPAKAGGGMIYASGRARVTLTLSKLGNNTSFIYFGGAGVYTAGSAQVTISEGTLITQSRAYDRGAAIYATNSSFVAVNNATLTLNSAINGAGVYAEQHAFVSILNASLLRDNVARVFKDIGGGAAVYASDNTTIHILGGSLLHNNTGFHSVFAEENVALVIANASRVGFADDTSCVALEGNATAVIAGSSVLSGCRLGLDAMEGSVVSIESASSVTDNYEGGIRAMDHATIRIRGQSHVSNNSVPGIAMYGEARLEVLEGSEISGQSMSHSRETYRWDRSGGGIYAIANSTVVIRSHAVIRGNVAAYGAGIAASENATVILASASVTGNTAFNGSNPARGGGVAVNDHANLTIIDSTMISNNVAGTEGGGVHAQGKASVTLGGGSQFLNNTAGLLGDDVRAGFNNTIYFDESVNINMLSSSVFWTRVNCVTGEILDGGFCKQCGPNLYSLSPASERCYVCPSKAACPGGDVIAPLAGHWHSHRYATQVHACPNEEVCLEGGVCSPEYTGHLCGSCGEGFGYAGPFKCAACNSHAIVLLLYFSGALALLLFICYTLHTTMADNQGACTTAADGAAQLPSARPSDLLKVFIKHMQYLIILGSLQVPWPDALVTTFRGMAWMFSSADSSLLVPLDCLLSDGGLPKAIKRQLVYVTAPIAFTLVTVLVLLLVRVVRRWSASRACTPNCHEQEPQHQPEMGTESIAYCMPALVLIVLFLFHPSLVHVGLTMFACYPLDKVPAPPDAPYPEYAIANASHGYWVQDMQQACWQGWHKAWAWGLGFPCTLIFCFLVPCGVVVIL